MKIDFATIVLVVSVVPVLVSALLASLRYSGIYTVNATVVIAPLAILGGIAFLAGVAFFLMSSSMRM